MDINNNKTEYLDILSTVNREGISDLINFLNNSDFFYAPASTKYHLNTDGGLCQHSLNVYYNLKKLNELYRINLPEDSIKIASLLHDLAKVGFYEKSSRNKKVYSEAGSKHDSLGNFDWVTEDGFTILPPEERYVAGDHGFNSFMLASKYIPLTEDEMVAIFNHHMGMDSLCSNRDINAIYDRYPLASLLHVADTLSVYVNENKQLNS